MCLLQPPKGMHGLYSLFFVPLPIHHTTDSDMLFRVSYERVERVRTLVAYLILLSSLGGCIIPFLLSPIKIRQQNRIGGNI